MPRLVLVFVLVVSRTVVKVDDSLEVCLLVIDLVMRLLNSSTDTSMISMQWHGRVLLGLFVSHSEVPHSALGYMVIGC